MCVGRTKKEQSNLQHVYILFCSPFVSDASCGISHISPLLHQTPQAPVQHSTPGQHPNLDPHPPQAMEI